MESNLNDHPHHACCCEYCSKQKFFPTAYKLSSCCSGSPSFIEHGSKLGAIANLCSATLGAGVLALPYAMLNAGLIPGIMLLFLAASITIISIDWIIEACQRTGLRTYEEITLQICGPRARRLEELCMFIFCFGTAVAYIIAVGDILDEGLISLFQNNAKDTHDNGNHYNDVPNFVNRESVMVLFWLVVMLPLSLLDKIDDLRYASLIGSSSVAFLVIVAMIHSSQDLTTNHLQLWPTSVWNVIRAFPIIMFDFSSHPNVCAIYDELDVENGDENDITNPEEEIPSFQDVHVGNDSATPCGCPPTPMPGRQYEDEISSFSSSPNTIDSKGAEEIPYSSTSLYAKAKSMQFVTRTGVSISLMLYMLIGFFTLADFGKHTMDNMLKNYCVYDTHDPLVISAFVGIAIAIIIAYPLNIFPSRLVVGDLLQQCKFCHQFRRRLRCSNYSHGQVSPEVRESFACSSSRCHKKEDFLTKNHEEANNTDMMGELPVSNSDEGEEKSEIYAIEELNSTFLNESIGNEEFPSRFSSPPPVPSNQCTSPPPITPLTKVQHVALTILISGASLLVAVVVPSITIVLGLMGGTASSIIVFVLPALFARNKYIAGKRTMGHSEEEMNQDSSHTNIEIMGTQSSNHSCKQDRNEQCGSNNNTACNDSHTNSDDTIFIRKRSRKRCSLEVAMVAPSVCKIVFIWTVILVGCILGVLGTGATFYDIFHPADTQPMCREK